MNLRSNAFIIAAAALSWTVAPTAMSQEPPAEDFSTQPPEPQESVDQSGPMDEQSTAADVDDGPAAARPSAPAAMDAGSIDNAKIEQFADAYLAVQTIQQQAATQLEATPDAASADQVKIAAESEMIAAVERTGLKIEEFNSIVETMASDMEVRDRITAKLQERSGG